MNLIFAALSSNKTCALATSECKISLCRMTHMSWTHLWMIFSSTINVEWSVCSSCLVPFVRQIWAAVGTESSKIYRTEHNHLSHLDTEHMVYLINTCLPHKMPLTNLSWLWFLSKQWAHPTQFILFTFKGEKKITQILLLPVLTYKGKQAAERVGANVNSSTRNRTRRVNLFEPCQHIIGVPGGGGGDNWGIWNKISTSLGGVWK